MSSRTARPIFCINCNFFLMALNEWKCGEFLIILSIYLSYFNTKQLKVVRQLLKHSQITSLEYSHY